MTEDVKRYPAATQDWLTRIPIMQQTVLLSAIRGMDGMRKLHPAKMLIRFYRRCVLIDALDQRAIENPYEDGGGDFTGPSLEIFKGHDQTPLLYAYDRSSPNGVGQYVPLDRWPLAMQRVADDFVRARDEMPLHYYSHSMHAFQIIGAHHPDEKIAAFWQAIYVRMAHALHLWPEEIGELDTRLGDDEAGWRAREDCAGGCST